jgi:hypothetical protein
VGVSVRSPLDTTESWDEIEVPVLTQEGKRILPAKRGNPQIIGRDGLAFCFQFETYGCIAMSGFLIDIQNAYRTHPITKPAFVGHFVARLRDSQPVFAQNDYRHRKIICAGNDFQAEGSR